MTSAPAPSPLLDRQLAVLGRLADVGLALAVALEQQVAQPATEPAAAPIFTGDLALAFSRISRAVRLTVALQAQLVDDAQRAERLAASDAQNRAYQDDIAADHADTDTKARIQRVIQRIAEADPEAKDAAERIVDEACERLREEDLYGDVLSRPVSETVAMICRDLGLSPDWPRLADEAWAREEMRSDAVGAPLAALVGQELPTWEPAAPFWRARSPRGPPS